MQSRFERIPGRWIYCNYPERLPQKALEHHYLNRVLVTGEAQLFASYVSEIDVPVTFGVQVVNPGARQAQVLLKNHGHRHSGDYPNWCDVEGGVWADYYAYTPRPPVRILPKRSVWLVQESVPARAYFNTLLRFTTTAPVWCLVYVYRDRASIDRRATCYPWDPASIQYRGVGDSVAIRAQVALRTSELPVSWNTHTCASPDEMVAIRDPCTGLVHACETGANLGNWGLPYLYHVMITNDQDHPAEIEFTAGGGGPGTTGYAAIRQRGVVSWTCPEENQWWHFLADRLEPGEQRSYDFEYIRISNATNPAAIRIMKV